MVCTLSAVLADVEPVSLDAGLEISNAELREELSIIAFPETDLVPEDYIYRVVKRSLLSMKQSSY
jgi:hypothetical protein